MFAPVSFLVWLREVLVGIGAREGRVRESYTPLLKAATPVHVIARSLCSLRTRGDATFHSFQPQVLHWTPLASYTCPPFILILSYTLLNYPT